MENKTLYDLRGLTTEQLQIISKALDVYSRLSMGQFWVAIPDVPNVRRLMGKLPAEWEEKFEGLVLQAGNVLTRMDGFGSYGILHSEVTEDARIACHFHHAIRHQFWMDRGEKDTYTVDARPADIVKDLKVDIKKREIKDDPEGYNLETYK